MGFIFKALLILCCLIPDDAFSLPLCINSYAPFSLTAPLKFCPYDGASCCDSAEDLQLQKLYASMNISSARCASLFKSLLCARCDEFSAQLFRFNPSVPVLCNSNASTDSSQSSQAAVDFCNKIWDNCANESVLNSPFLKKDSNYTKLTDIWNSKSDFCNVHGGPSAKDAVCFSGEPVKLNDTGTPGLPNGVCFEKIGNGSYLNMVAHPDGSNRAFFLNQAGNIWLANIPKIGSGGTLELDELSPFLDLTDEVHFDGEFGMMGMAFHPKFTENGRMFVSFNCDKVKWPGCAGRCSCNSDVNCDPSKLVSDNGGQPCQFQSVIAEFTVNGTAPPPLARSASPVEVRRIFTMGLPFTSHHGGQILFGPTDGYLYLVMGDGGGEGDPYNFSQNKKSLLGKVMRLDVDTFPGVFSLVPELASSVAEKMTKLDLWGNYTIPADNPFVDDPELAPEIWSSGLRNPWRCSYDVERPSYFMCGDVGHNSYEEVNIITKGGNYGWRLYEGHNPYTPPTSPGGNTSLSSINPIFPVMGYSHSDVNSDGSASITGGYFYRSATDPCLYGRYLYADLYGNGFWTGVEWPENSGNFTAQQIPFSCGSNSPLNCSLATRDWMGYVFSFGEDNNKDIFTLTSSGVYRVVQPSRCKYSCSKLNMTTDDDGFVPGTNFTPPSHAVSFAPSSFVYLLMLYSFIFCLLLLFS